MMANDSKLDFDLTLPYLEHYPEPGGGVHCIPLDHFPFRIGRCSTADFTIYSRQVSKDHTEIDRQDLGFRIRDLDSTNGTFVNGQRIVESALLNGDIIHIAQKEFRFSFKPVQPANDSDKFVTDSISSQMPFSMIHGSEHLRELLVQHRVSIVFQPILHLQTRRILGYEALGRGAHDELSPNPCDLFRLAEHCRLAPDLSRLFRQVALDEALRLPGSPLVFLNVHPSEMENETLVSSLKEVPSEIRASERMVLEIHEDVVTETATLRRFRDRVKELGILLAYDDFGAGQARLAELAEVPPDFVKLDMALVRGIDGAKARQELLQALNRLSDDFGVQVIAEGIETSEEARICNQLGCAYGQGFFLGRPQPVSFFTQADQPESCPAQSV
jgi:EAL domain-containing protein (putative c-di-GMP-specific phosphodiesterase class I)